jgi:hypothetical protein
MTELSPTTKGLLRAARQDGPGAAGRAQIWSAVSAKAAGGGALGAAGGKAAASAATAKLFAMGALLGSAITVGVAAMVLHVHIGGPSLRPDGALDVHADTESESLTPTARPGSPVRGRTPLAAGAGAPGAAGAPLPKHAAGHARSASDDARMPLDSLGREAELVAEARGAVMRGEPEAALGALHAAQSLPAHAMEPEELSLEVRALRALGKLDEANAADARLRARFPEHALAR